jgi:hypothetical protein
MIVAGAVAGLAVAGGGAAVAATQFGSPKEESQAVVNDAAQQLGIDPSRLSAALKQALKNRVDAAVAAGRITKAQGDEIKARIDSGELPLFFGHGRPGGFHHGFGERHIEFRGLDDAASYLGLSEDALRTQIESGKTLAQVAQVQGKSVDGLVQAMVAGAKKRLDAAVAAGKLTAAQRDEILPHIEADLKNLVNGVGPRGRPFPFRPPMDDRGDDAGFGLAVA